LSLGIPCSIVKMNFAQKNFLCVASIGLAVSGCASLSDLKSPWSSNSLSSRSADTPINSEADVKAALDSGITRSQILIRSGMGFLLKGDLDKAQEVFNTALKFDFNNAQLHFLNALAYHQHFLRGNADSFALAKAGYRTALLQDPAMEGIAYLQLGRLFLDAKNRESAKQAFALAVDANHQSADALYGLAQASALDGDVTTSYWAASELDRLKWDNPLLYRLKAVHAALAQQPDRARALVADYAKSTIDRGDAKYLQGRVEQLLAIKTSLREYKSSESSGDRPSPTLLAQLPAMFDISPQSPVAPPQATPSTVNQAPQQVEKWFRCDDAPAIPSRPPTSIGGQGATDENITTAPLPAPCTGEVPKTAIIEMTVVQTSESKNTNLGINLLNGLSAIFTLERARTYTKSTDVAEEVRTNKLVIANTVENSIDVLRYSLNIANAAYTKNEILSRPTLAAIDRVPAVFFSGGTVTLGIAGTAGSASTIVDKSVGISLTVTPTFIDDENVLVSMRATRSNIETNLVPVNTSVLLQQSRNTITASAKLKFGETFVVNGLAAQQTSRAESGTPVLQDIPLLQYLFKQSAKGDSTLQILTLITIRRPPGSETAAEQVKSKSGDASRHKLSGAVDEFAEVQSRPVNDEILSRLRARHELFRRLREKDLIQESTGPRSALQRTLDDVKDIIYY
jgi:hypothetical protein